MIGAFFEDMVVGSYATGVQKYCHGVYEVRVDEISPDAPQDWELGPTMKAGEWGAFLANELHPRGHSPYAFATGKTIEEAQSKARSHFRIFGSVWESVT